MTETKPIRCFIADDEPLARSILKQYISDLPKLELRGECNNAIQALEFLQENTVDLLFLDINMPQLKGTDLLKILKDPPKVIFTTAHPEYALEGYELDVVDYLLKPIQFERFVKAVHKAMHLPIQNKEWQPELKNRQENGFIYFRADRKMVKVMLEDILYVESMKDYIKVNTKDGVIITKQSITSLEAMLPEEHFIRTHRCFIVSLNKIKAYTTEIIEIDRHEIPIGKLYRNGVLKVIQ